MITSFCKLSSLVLLSSCGSYGRVQQMHFRRALELVLTPWFIFSKIEQLVIWNKLAGWALCLDGLHRHLLCMFLCYFTFFNDFQAGNRDDKYCTSINFSAEMIVCKQVAGLEKSLHTNLEQGIKDETEEIEKRKAAYGANTYPKTKPKGILVCYQNCCWILLVSIHHFYWVYLSFLKERTLNILLILVFLYFQHTFWYGIFKVRLTPSGRCNTSN